MKRLVVLSGGMDSTTALYDAVERSTEVSAVMFNYGSKHNDAEYERAVESCEKLAIGFRRIHLPLDSYFESNLLKSGGDIPEGHYEESTMKKTVVPFRNGIMLSVAAGLAESLDYDAIVIGNHFGDHAIYPDCRREFINPMAVAIQKGTYKRVLLESPFVEMTKAQICKKGDELGVDWKMTYSCYKGAHIHCGRCSTCFERREAFIHADVKDPTHYVDQTPFDLLEKEYKEQLQKNG